LRPLIVVALEALGNSEQTSTVIGKSQPQKPGGAPSTPRLPWGWGRCSAGAFR